MQDLYSQLLILGIGRNVKRCQALAILINLDSTTLLLVCPRVDLTIESVVRLCSHVIQEGEGRVGKQLILLAS